MKRIIIIFALFLALTIIWTGGWLFARDQINQQVAALSATDNAQNISCGALSVTGFPFRLDVKCTDAKIIDGDAEFSLPKITATVLVYRPTHALAFFEGPLTYTDAFFGTSQHLKWSKLEASLRIKSWQLARASVQGENLKFVDSLLGESLTAAAQSVELHIIDAPSPENESPTQTNLAVFARITDGQIPNFDVHEGQLTLEAELSKISADIRTWANPNILPTLADTQSSLTLNRFDIKDSKSAMGIAGTAQLTNTGTVDGDLTAHSTNLRERFGNAIPKQMQTILFGQKQDDGSYSQILTIRSGAIFVGLLPVATIPPLF